MGTNFTQPRKTITDSIHRNLTAKKLELIYIAVFSIVSLVFFFMLLSSNGLVLGNDPAFHLGRAEMILASGEIPMGDFMWYPPLYHMLLSAIIAFTGAASIEQLLFVMKALTALINWLLIASVYLIGSKFFGKKYGILASALMFLSLPLYEINSWGGYTTILSLAFMCVLILYLPAITRSIQPVFITFFVSFSLVLSQQLGTFLIAFIVPPSVLVLFITSKGKYLKAGIVALLGGAVAFFLYYIQPILARFDMVIYHVFFGIQNMVYQIPSVTLDSLFLSFGFALVFAFSGLFLALHKLRKEKKLNYFLILFLSLLIPLIFSQSYLFGLYLPYQMFTYFLLPPVAVFAAISLSYVIDLAFASYSRIKIRRKRLMQIITATIVIAMFLVLLFRFQTVGARINEGTNFYSTSDLRAYEAAVWLRNNYPSSGTVVVTEKPGLWFGMYSGKMVIAETDPVIERNVIAESVLDLSYEIEQPFTLVRGLEAKDLISDEMYVSIDSVWKRVSYLSEQQVFLSFNQNNIQYSLDLSGLNRNITFVESGYPKGFIISYSNDNVLLTENILVQNDSYSVDVVWTLTPLHSEITNASLYVSSYFDPSLSFNKAYVPGLLNWQNPWDNPSYIAGNNDWALVDFSPRNMNGGYIGVYDGKHQVVYAIKFENLPDQGNIGVLANKMIDALRFQYQLGNVTLNEMVSSKYRILTFSKTSYPGMELGGLQYMFDSKPTSFDVITRDYTDYIKENDVKFVVYDKKSFDSKLLHSNLLEQVYSNNEFIVCKIKGSKT